MPTQLEPNPFLDHKTARRDPAGAPSLAARGVVKRFDATEALQEASLEVPAGAMVSLLGASGSGKTTLLRCIAGLEQPDAGDIWIGDELVSSEDVDVPAERRRVGMVFQGSALFPHLSVERNVGFALTRRERRGGLVEDLLERVDLAGFESRMPDTLSGGQQQRVAIARALAHRPSVILLDEPFSSLDSGLRAQVRCDVRNLLRSLEVTALFVTHDQEEAFELGDEVAVMVEGRVEQQATPGQLYDCPCTRIVAEFIGDANILSGVAEGSFAETAFDEVPLLGESVGRVDLVVRPEQIAISLGDDGAVLDLEFYGHHTTYQVRLDSGEVLTVRALGGPTLTTGDRVELRYDGPPVASFAPPSTGTIDLAATVPLEADVERIALQALGRS